MKSTFDATMSITHVRFKIATSILNKQGATPVPSFVAGTPGAGGSRGFAKSFKTPTMVSTRRPASGYIPARNEDGEAVSGSSAPHNAVLKTLPSGNVGMYTSTSATKPGAQKIVIGEKSNSERANWGGAIFDPHAEGAVVMNRPPDKWARDQ
jgi:DNA repair and recombination protein RAD54B